jgi:hypothetical protein
MDDIRFELIQLKKQLQQVSDDLSKMRRNLAGSIAFGVVGAWVIVSLLQFFLYQMTKPRGL